MEHEEWRAVPVAPGYFASSLGRIKGLKGGVLKPSARGKGRRYLGLTFIVDGDRKDMNLHRVVAVTFLGAPPHPNSVVAHQDGNGHNNSVENLRWTTQSDNLADRLIHDTHDRGERNVQAKLTEANVQAIRASSGSNSQLAAIYGVGPATIGKIQRRERWAWLS